MEKLVKKPLNVKRRFARTTEQDKISGYVLTYLSACEHLIAIDSFQIDHAQTFLQLSNLLLNIFFVQVKKQGASTKKLKEDTTDWI